MTTAHVDGISAVDLFCGAGGLSYGLQAAGITVAAGYDIDPRCKYPYETNVKAPFVKKDVRKVSGAELKRAWGPGTVRVLAGCAPCQPFSSYRRGADTSGEAEWALLDEFSRLIRTTMPHIVTMENVPRVARAQVFKNFLSMLTTCGYRFKYQSCNCPEYGLPQSRRRLVLMASRLGPIALPRGPYGPRDFRTVRDAIGKLPPLESGAVDTNDSLHRARALSDINLQRIRASKPGGTWEDWPAELRAPCHQRATGASFKSVYARMSWDEPAPTITAGSHNYGTGRFGHPSQDRAISLREAAILQSFPASYSFVAPDEKIELTPLARLIGNAVPPLLGRYIGRAIVDHVQQYRGTRALRCQSSQRATTEAPSEAMSAAEL